MDCAELGPVQALFDGGRPGIWKINLGANADDIEPELARGRNFHRREPTHASSNSWKKPIATSDLTVVDGMFGQYQNRARAVPARVDAHRKLDAVKRRYLSEREVERLMAGFCSRPV
jgi:hypothetical protein